MSLTNSLINCFEGRIDVSVKETFYEYSISFSIDLTSIEVKADQLVEVLKGVKDQWEISFFDYSAQFARDTNYQVDLTVYLSGLKDDQVDSAPTKLLIKKESENGEIICYDANAFVDSLKADPTIVIAQFGTLKRKLSTLRLRCFDGSNAPGTSFLNATDNARFVQSIDWGVLFQDAHFEQYKDYPFQPGDFFLQRETGSKSLNRIMNWWTLAMSICLTANTSSISYDKQTRRFLLKAVFHGVKPVNIELSSTTQVSYNLANAWKDYSDWVFDGPGISGRLGVFRNVYTNSAQDGKLGYYDLLKPVKQAFSVYLKTNAKDYVEIHKKILDNIDLMSKNAQSAADSFSANFRTGFLVSLGYCIMAFFIKYQSSNRLFSQESLIIGTVLWFVGILHLCLMCYLARQDQKLLRKNQEKAMNSFSALLQTKEFEESFSEPFHEINHSLKDKLEVYGFLWGITLILFLVFLIWGFSLVS
ncbi:MAG: hypothetical protein RRB13_04385 [bacterium]|nr:hypothetical protein [bacterium]